MVTIADLHVTNLTVMTYMQLRGGGQLVNQVNRIIAVLSSL